MVESEKITIQRFNDSTIQRFNDSTIQRFNDSTIQRFNNPVLIDIIAGARPSFMKIAPIIKEIEKGQKKRVGIIIIQAHPHGAALRPEYEWQLFRAAGNSRSQLFGRERGRKKRQEFVSASPKI